MFVKIGLFNGIEENEPAVEKNMATSVKPEQEVHL